MKNLYILLIFLISLSISACSTVEQATVKINTGLSNVQATAEPVTVIDRVLRFFSSRATAAPVGITDILVFVTGPDMEDMELQFPVASTLTIKIPAGSDRKFELNAYSEGGDIYAGAAVTDLSPRQVKDVTITMQRTMDYSLSDISFTLEPHDIAVYGADVYIAGSIDGNGAQWLIKKINSNDPGADDSDFTSTNDMIISGTPAACAYALAVDSENIYIAGNDTNNAGAPFTAWRIEKRDRLSGVLDSGFGTGGSIIYSPAFFETEYVIPRAIAVDSASIYIGGEEYDGNTNYNWRLEKRLKSSGALDSGFMSGSGILSFDTLFDPSAIHSLALADGNIYAGGYFNDGGDEQADWRIEKIGISASSYTTNWLTPPRFMGNSAINAIEVKDGCIYAAGSDDSQWRVEKYNADTGEYSNDFGENGVVTVNGPSYSYEATSLAVDERYIYVAGHEEIGDTDYAWRIEKRDRETGELVSEFGTNGMISFNPGTGSDEIRAIAIDDMFIYITGTDNSETYTSILIQKRLKRTGELTANPEILELPEY